MDIHTLRVQQVVRNKRLVLKQVLGHEDPKDLLTKHSLSKARLVKLTALYDCRFTEGRAESAPFTRTGASSKVTIAQADRSLGGLCDTEAGLKFSMPHLGSSNR